MVTRKGIPFFLLRSIYSETIMEQYKAAIQKVWKDALSTQEKLRLLEELIRDESGWKAILHKEYEQHIHNGDVYLSMTRSAQLLQQLHAKIHLMDEAATFTAEPNALVILKNRKICAILAAAAAILIAAFIWYPSEKKEQPDLTIALYQPVNEHRRVINQTAQQQELTLEDGSSIKLAANASITWINRFRPSDRTIELNGQAWFDVAKDSQRPFSVHASGVTTTALGTKFMVNSAHNKQVVVQLSEGKVVVRSGNDSKPVYLQPGQQCIVDAVSKTIKNNFIIFSIDKPVIASKKIHPIRRIKALEFVQTPLTDVLTQLGHRYQVHFKFQAEEIGNDQVTGTFLPSDSLSVALSLLRTINNLSFNQQQDTILVSKLK